MSLTAYHRTRNFAKTPEPPGQVRNGHKPPAKTRTKSATAATHHVRPMLATLVDEPFDRDGWIFEVKWDGFRVIADVDNGNVSLYSRNQQPFNDVFPPIAKSLAKLKHRVILDGEAVVVDEKGRSRFQLLQNYRKTGQGRLHYYVFDLLELDGRDLRGEPLSERRKLLAPLLRGLPQVGLSEAVEAGGVAFFAAARGMGLEGIVAKDAASKYAEGRRSLHWLKIKTRNRQEAVIAGFTEPRGSRKDLGALVLGVYDGDELVYIGHTGAGSRAADLTDLRKKLDPLEQDKCPLTRKPRVNAPVHWVAPRLVCEVAFQEWTDDGKMRQPIFVGLRSDKPALSVHREIVMEKPPKPLRAKKASPSPSSNKWSEAAEPQLSNLDKVYWPNEEYTKGDLIDYYREVAPVLLTHLRDRPLSLHRHPDGIIGKSFFQKDVTKLHVPDWVETVAIASSKGEKTRYAVCQNLETLLYVANLGCIEINPWNSRVGSLDKPDFLIIDLDPEDIPFANVIETASDVHNLLEKIDVPSHCKTSGKRGLHIVVPLGAKHSYDAARQFAEIVANVVHHRLPETTSVLRSPKQRQQRVYLDFLQNSKGQTLAAPYSVRPAPRATVATPLNWREVRKGLDPTAFTIKTLPRRLDRLGDLWQPVLGAGIDLEAALTRLQNSDPGTSASNSHRPSGE